MRAEVHKGYTKEHMEHMAMALQIYLKLDRLDLAKKKLLFLQYADEDAILTQLGSVYCSLATGSTGAADAVHALNSLTEQYGASSLLANLQACAYLQSGDYAAAEEVLQDCLREQQQQQFPPVPDTYINLIACAVQQNNHKATTDYVCQMKQHYPKHSFCAGLERVTAAFDRESVKYKV